MIDRIYKGIQTDLDQLCKSIDWGEYTGQPDYFTMRRLAGQISSSLGKLKATIHSDQETRMGEVVHLTLENVLPDHESAIERVLEGS
jgi:hypothetical protein